MLLELKRIQVPPGQKVWLQDASWLEFEAILRELGDRRAARVAYDRGTVEIMTPLPEHEASKILVADFIKVLLEELDIEFYPLGSTTFKREQLQQGIEPDECFYIRNEAAVRGKERLDLDVDPPPDLVLEIEVTSRTHPEIYAALGVPELWRFAGGTLDIGVLQGGRYVSVPESPTFPGWPLPAAIPAYLQRSKTAGRNRAMGSFRAWVRQKLAEA